MRSYIMALICLILLVSCSTHKPVEHIENKNMEPTSDLERGCS